MKHQKPNTKHNINNEFTHFGGGVFGSDQNNINYNYQSGTNKQDDAFAFDLVGNILEINKKKSECGVGGTNELKREFTYDPMYRLSSATGRENVPGSNYPFPGWDDTTRSTDPNTTTAYTRKYNYDKLGNIDRLRQIGSHPFTSEFDYTESGGIKVNNRLDSITIGTDSYSYQYDAAGNQTVSNSNRKFDWDAGNRLLFFKNQAGTSEPSVEAQYLYDSSGNRVKKIVRKQGGNYEIRVYIDGIFEYFTDEDDEQNTVHIMDDQSRIATVRIGASMGDSTPAVKYTLENNIGSSVVTLDAAGSIVNEQEYYPFGETSFGSYAKKRYQYTGKERDEESGLYYYGARYYAPWTCRFISVDPLAADYPYLTPYNYAGNKPITHKDIDGLQGTGDPPVENNVARQDNTRVATNVPNADNLKPVEPAEANVYQINKETGAAVKIDVSGLDLSKRDQALLEKGGEFIYRNNRLSITSKETVNALNNPSEAGSLTEFALGKLKEDFKTYEGNFPENYYEDFSKAVFEKSIELNGADAGVNAASDFLDIRVMSEGSAILHSYETYARSNENTGFDKVSHFAVSARLQYNNGGLVTDFQQYSKEIFFDEIPSWFGDDIGFDSRDMLANNRGQAFGKALKEKYHPKPAEPRFRRFGE